MLNKKLSVFFLGVLVVIAGGVVFKVASSVIMPMLIALLASFILFPVIKAMKKIKIPNTLGIIIILSILAGVIYLLVMILYNTISIFTLQLPWYMEQLKGIYRDITQQIMMRYSISTADFFLEYDWGRLVRGYLVSFADSITRIAGYSFIVLIYLLFLLLEYPAFTNKLNRAYPKMAKRIIIIIGKTTRGVGKYLAVKAFISAITGFCTWIILTIIGLDFALLWGVMTFFLNFIPYVGTMIVVTCIVLQSIVQFYPSLGMVLLVTISISTLQFALGNIIDPRMQGGRLKLSVVVILFSLAFWGWIWGIMGAFLAIPITVTIKTICLNIPVLRPIGILMGKDFVKEKIKPENKIPPAGDKDMDKSDG
ncbi:MAG: AI-2E family transporter [Spirochaetes bacterium]|nr:AI-2E family transporter [Spirochaetota bacterium]